MQTEPPSDVLPPILAEIAGIAGIEAARALAREKGGTEVYIPERAPDGHWLVQCVGREAADRIGRVHGDCRLTIPLGGTGRLAEGRKMAAAMLRSGVPNSEIARRVGIHTRTVQRISASLRREGSKKDSSP